MPRRLHWVASSGAMQLEEGIATRSDLRGGCKTQEFCKGTLRSRRKSLQAEKMHNWFFSHPGLLLLNILNKYSKCKLLGMENMLDKIICGRASHLCVMQTTELWPLILPPCWGQTQHFFERAKKLWNHDHDTCWWYCLGITLEKSPKIRIPYKFSGSVMCGWLSRRRRRYSWAIAPQEEAVLNNELQGEEGGAGLSPTYLLPLLSILCIFVLTTPTWLGGCYSFY